MTAENCLRILNERLSKFDISLETDIVAIVTDGPNVMIKVGRLVCAEQQLCLAHGINLAVCDVLYKKHNYLQDSPTSDDMDDNNDDDHLEDLDCSESGLILMSQNDLAREHIPELTQDENIKELIEKVRKVVIYFKRSPLKNETVLQKYVKIEHGKELSLLLDCKTRWNSLLTMLERFYLLKSCIQKALIDLNHPICLEDVEFELVNKIVDVLTPIKLTVEAICRRDANLCTADAALNFLIKQLSSKNSALAKKIKTCLVDRIKQRRSDNLTGVLNYLQNPRKDEENQLLSELEWHNLFPVPTQALLRKQIKSIVKRLNSRDDTEEEERSESLTDVELRPETSQPQLTLKEKLQLEIDKSMKSPDPEIQVQNESGMTNSIRREMSLFENGGVRGYYLETAYKYLMSIPPTSVEPERAFSAAAYVGNKLRSRLGISIDIGIVIETGESNDELLISKSNRRSRARTSEIKRLQDRIPPRIGAAECYVPCIRKVLGDVPAIGCSTKGKVHSNPFIDVGRVSPDSRVHLRNGVSCPRAFDTAPWQCS
ncbi:hypothetical protein EVAR_98391_1 [Eumeta japonica]|uniref:HAT C-terminal dimerisation domain-containing protein n=1 Tax=Eumeta variegata TaxID=151549 RepID=A0A4C1XQA5_EUMVA|nr:hypothetical protein EVAR_98391_1 [Eumeta japonica]